MEEEEIFKMIMAENFIKPNPEIQETQGIPSNGNTKKAVRGHVIVELLKTKVKS